MRFVRTRRGRVTNDRQWPDPATWGDDDGNGDYDDNNDNDGDDDDDDDSNNVDGDADDHGDDDDGKVLLVAGSTDNWLGKRRQGRSRVDKIKWNPDDR
jgi:hypothetical protein